MGYEIILKNEKDLIYDEALSHGGIGMLYSFFNFEDIDKMMDLKWIQLSSIGIDQLPMEKVKEKKIKITNNKGGYSIPMGEWIVLKILELHKQSYDLYSNQMNRKWKMNGKVLELYGKTVGFVGQVVLRKKGQRGSKVLMLKF